MESHGIKGRIAGSLLLLWSYMTLLCASFLLVPLLLIFVISPVAFRYIYDRILVGPWHCAIGVSFSFTGVSVFSDLLISSVYYFYYTVMQYTLYSVRYMKLDDFKNHCIFTAFHILYQCNDLI